MLKTIKNQKGVTLIELLIVGAIMLIALTAGFNFLIFGNQVFSSGSSQYNVQSSVRLAADTIEDAVRYSSDVTIFGQYADLTITDPFSYLYLDGNQLVYSYVDNAGVRQLRTLSGELTSLTFSNSSTEENLLGLTLVGNDRDQDYELAKEIGLPNFEMNDLTITGHNGVTSGTALEFRQDTSTPVSPGLGEWAINPSMNFNMYPGTTRTFFSNRDVLFTSSNSSIVSIAHLPGDDRQAIATASTAVTGTATITATLLDAPYSTKTVQVTVIPKIEYTVDIYHGGTIIETGEFLNLVIGDTKTVNAVITPALADGLEIVTITWGSDFTDATGTNYFAVTPEEGTSASVEGINTGEDAKLTATVVLNDDTVLEETILVNVTTATEYAKLTGMSFSSSTLIPSFHPDTTNYTVDGNGTRTLTVSATPGATVKINGVETTSQDYNLSQSFNVVIEVSEPGKTTRYYFITN